MRSWTLMVDWYEQTVRHCGLVVSAPAWDRLWVRFLVVSDSYPMFIEPTITWVPSGFSGYIWLDTKILLTKKKKKRQLSHSKKWWNWFLHLEIRHLTSICWTVKSRKVSSLRTEINDLVPVHPMLVPRPPFSFRTTSLLSMWLIWSFESVVSSSWYRFIWNVICTSKLHYKAGFGVHSEVSISTQSGFNEGVIHKKYKQFVVLWGYSVKFNA